MDEQLDISEMGDMLSKNCFPELEGTCAGNSPLGRLESVWKRQGWNKCCCGCWYFIHLKRSRDALVVHATVINDVGRAGAGVAPEYSEVIILFVFS